MIIGRVVGKVWSTKKDENLNGQKFLVVRPLKNHKEESDKFIVAADGVGAGQGDLVMITQGGAARKAAGSVEVPVDSTIIAIIDSIEVEDDE